MGDPVRDTAEKLAQALETLKQMKPNDRSEEDRRWAVTITEMEKAFAYFQEYVVKPDADMKAQVKG